MKAFLFVAFVLISVAGIVWMIASSPHMPSLTCQSYADAGSWSSFGRGTEN